ncbi:hypothetical protein D3C76_820580 [compost metagenome]
MPSRKAINEVIMIALASYDTASLIHTTTANARIARTRCPATGKSAGSGSINTPIRAATPNNKPIGILTRVDCAPGVLADELMGISLLCMCEHDRPVAMVAN